MYVLAPDARLLKAEDTNELEQPLQGGTGYNHAAIAAFLTKYAPCLAW